MLRNLVVVLSAAAGLAADRAAAGEVAYYSIKMNRALIGYAVVEHQAVVDDGRQRQRVISETTLKVALLGTTRNVRLESQTLLESDTGQVVSYDLTSTTNDVVQQVSSEFSGGKARTWRYRPGDERGEAVETELPQGALILGSNNFAHWQLLLRTAEANHRDGVAQIAVFQPDSGQVERVELKRGESVRVVAADESYSCTGWHLDSWGIVVLADQATGRLVRMTLPAQGTVIELADESVVKLAQKARAEEVLDQHFTASNVRFDRFLDVAYLEAAIDVRVIGSGVTDAPSVLATPIQQFDGDKQAGRVVGTVTVRTKRYDTSRSPAFPAKVDSGMQQWLEPSTYIESDDPAIQAQTAKLLRGTTTRWEALRRIGDWVHGEIAYTIADTPSARLALETRRGDCGPHATLMVAMLRSAGIPARLVGGLMYTPTFGGSFGQHAWVEVHLGESGWVGVDPTTGEFDKLSATHIKLFEGLGGVKPQKVQVVAFQPPNEEVPMAKASEPRKLNWELGKTYTFHYRQGEKQLGTESFKIAEVDRDGQPVYQLTSKVELTDLLTSDATLTVARDARPLHYERSLSAGGQDVKIVCEFKNEVVEEKISGTTNLIREIKLPEGAYCFDNNLMGCLVLIGSQLNLEAGEPLKVQAFHPSSLQIIPLTFTAKEPAALEVGGERLECFECDVAPIKNTFWITTDGRFVRAQQGDLVIELAK